MRSELIFGAMKYVPNRFLLTTLAAKATRKLHKPNTRVEETANQVLERFTRADPLAHEPSIADLRACPRAVQGEILPSYVDLQQVDLQQYVA